MHRSLSDQSASEESPTNFVLVPVESGNVLSRKLKDGKSETASVLSKASGVSKSSRVSKDHINAMGFANDGYDYSRHFRDYKGGKFMGADGKMAQYEVGDEDDEIEAKSKFEIANPELFESRELDVEAITISADIMDADLHEALFAENATELFEELDDDFVAKALEGDAPEDPEFDKHIAELLAKSERQVFGGMMGGGGKLSIGGKKGDKVTFQEGGEEYYDDEEGDDYYYDSQDEIYSDEYAYDDGDDGDDNADNGATNYPGYDIPISEEQKNFSIKFEKALNEEYGEDDIGGLDGEEIEGGNIDLDEDEIDDELDKALDEFIDVYPEEYNAVISKSNISKLENSNFAIRSKVKEKIFEDRREIVEDNSDKLLLQDKEYLKSQIIEAEKAQEEAIEFIERLEIEERSGVIGEEILKASPYLAKEKVVEEWDCESILSTYSTTENHPTVIRAPSSRFKEHKSKFLLADEKAYEQRLRTMENTEHLLRLDKSRRQFEDSEGPVPQIVLKGKLGLPQGFEPGKKRFENKSLAASAGVGVVGAAAAAASNDTDSDNGEDDDSENLVVDTSIGRPKNETKEEKAARKKAIKEAKKEKREVKKATKTAYNDESKKLANQNINAGEVNRVPVFRYS